MAPNDTVARTVAFATLGPSWAFMYGPDSDNSLDTVDWSRTFPRGELGRIDAVAEGSPGSGRYA